MPMPFINREWLAQQAPAERARIEREYVILGYHPRTKDYLMLPVTDRSAGTYVLGVQQAGKSSFLETPIAYDIRMGNAVVVIDPHDQLAKNIIASVPADKLPKISLLDMTDEDYPFGVNLFAAGKLNTGGDYSQAVNRIMRIFGVLWPETTTQQHLPMYVRATTLALLSNPGATLADMDDFLTDNNFRTMMLRTVHDQSVLHHWQDHDQLSPKEQQTRIQPLRNRLASLFMGRNLVRNILGQRKNSIDFRRAIENKEILFIKLPLNTFGDDARLIGTIIISQLYTAVFSFGDLPEAQRPGVSIYVDEFQNFNTGDFNTLFVEGRKFGMRLTVAHQYRSQLNDDLQSGTMTARTKVCFQTTPEDAREMAHLFVKRAASLRPEDVEQHPVNYLLAHESPYILAHVFTEAWLRPFKARWGTRRVKITDLGVNIMRDVGNIFHALATPQKMYQHPSENPPEVMNPLEHVDALLRKVMQTNNPWLPIPVEAVEGFANTGWYSFYSALPKHRNLLEGAIAFPADLVGNGAVLHDPRDGMEELYVFLFLLRGTMQALAEQPLGESKPISTTDIAGRLTHLPQRHAYVKGGDDIGLIYTLQTPPKLEGQALTDRLRMIQAQTRAKYCRPRDEIDRMYKGRATGAPQPQPQAKPTPGKSRWDI